MRTGIAEFTNASTQTVAASGNVLFSSNTYPNEVYSYNSSTGAISFLRPGIYEITSSFLVEATGAGDVTITMQNGNTDVPGAIAAASLAASSDYATLPICNVIKINPGTASTFAAINFDVSAACSIASAECIIKRVG